MKQCTEQLCAISPEHGLTLSDGRFRSPVATHQYLLDVPRPGITLHLRDSRGKGGYPLRGFPSDVVPESFDVLVPFFLRRGIDICDELAKDVLSRFEFGVEELDCIVAEWVA